MIVIPRLNKDDDDDDDDDVIFTFLRLFSGFEEPYFTFNRPLGIPL